MSDFTRLLLSGILLGALAGCAGLELEKAESLEPSGSEFSKNLYSGYIELSELEHYEGDYRDSDNFAMRAISAAGNKPSQPEDIAARNLPKNKVGELSVARARLMSALAAGARDKAPIQAANAQVMFDCWMQEQEENRQPDDVALCKSGFTQALLGAETAVKPTPMARAPKKAPPPKKVLKKFVVYFAFGSSKVTPDSTRVILQAIDAAKELKAKSVYLAGHTDRAGLPSYNIKLSGMRANAVAKVIEGGGISGRLFSLRAFGEKMNAVKNSPGAREPRNRRVEILISY